LRAECLNLSFTYTDTLALANSSSGAGSGGDVNSADSLKEAREIIEELRNRNFTLVEDTAAREKESVRNASLMAVKLKEQANAINERASKFNNTFAGILAAFKHLRKESGNTKEKSANATSLINMAKDIDWKVRISPIDLYRLV
jgi:hypothetical protein